MGVQMESYSKQQKRLLAIGLAKGELSHQDIIKVYTDVRFGKNSMKRLMLLDFFTITQTGFLFNQEKNNEVIEILQT